MNQPQLLEQIKILEEIKEGLTHLQRLYYYGTTLSANPYAFSSLQVLAEPSHIFFGSGYAWKEEVVITFSIRGVETYEGFDDRMRKGLEGDNALSLFPRLKEQHQTNNTVILS